MAWYSESVRHALARKRIKTKPFGLVVTVSRKDYPQYQDDYMFHVTRTYFEGKPNYELVVTDMSGKTTDILPFRDKLPEELKGLPLKELGELK